MLKRFEDEKVFVKIKEIYDYVEEVIIDMGLKFVLFKEYVVLIIFIIVLSEDYFFKVVGDILVL